MTRTLLLALALSACSNAKIQLDDTSGSLGDDTGTDADDTASDTDDTDDTFDTGDTDQEPVLVPDYSTWEGSRRFYYDYSDWGYECDETVVETGTLIPEGTSDYEALHEVCGICDYFYEVTPDREEACEWIPLGTTWRGVALSDGDAAVYLYRESDGGIEEYAADESASFDGTSVLFDYQFEFYTEYLMIDVAGTITYPLVEQE